MIDKRIKETFKQEKESLEKSYEQLQSITNMLRSPNLTYRVRSNLEENCRELEQHIQDIKTERSYNFYLLESIPILEKYKKILRQPMKMSFTGKKTSDNKDKTQIIYEYLDIAKKYVDLYVPENDGNDPKITCENCNNKSTFQIVDEVIYICEECGCQQEVISHASSYNDVDRVNISAKYVYDRRVHFRDCMNQYQGKQNSTIDPKVYEDLEKQFELHGLLVKSEFREIRFSKITRDHVTMFLKETGHTKHYEDVVLIHYNMTGKKPDDITYLEEKLMNDFDALTELYDKKFKIGKKIDRKNFINTHYVLFQLLRRHKYPCKRKDFNILKTLDRKSFHDDITIELFTELGFTFTQI